MIQLNGIKPQVYLDTSMNKTPAILPKSNYRSHISASLPISKFNDHKVILFGRNSNLQDINFFELLLKQTGITPEELINKTLKLENIIGKGKEAEVFKIPLKGFNNFLLRRNLWDRMKPAKDFALEIPVNPFKENENISMPIATIGPYKIINKIEGKGFDHPLNFIRENVELKYRMCTAYDSFDDYFFNGYVIDLQSTKNLTPEQREQLQAYNSFKDSYINQLKTLAELPISSYRKMFDDIKLIYDNGFGIDYSPGNLFYNDKTKQIGFIDLEKEPKKEFDLFKLCESLLATPFMQFIDFNSKDEARIHCKKIIEKLSKTSEEKNIFDKATFNRISYAIDIYEVSVNN